LLNNRRHCKTDRRRRWRFDDTRLGDGRT